MSGRAHWDNGGFLSCHTRTCFSPFTTFPFRWNSQLSNTLGCRNFCKRIRAAMYLWTGIEEGWTQRKVRCWKLPSSLSSSWNAKLWAKKEYMYSNEFGPSFCSSCLRFLPSDFWVIGSIKETLIRPWQLELLDRNWSWIQFRIKNLVPPLFNSSVRVVSNKTSKQGYTVLLWQHAALWGYHVGQKTQSRYLNQLVLSRVQPGTITYVVVKVQRFL